MERKVKKSRRFAPVDLDRISELPDELVGRILSSGLAMKEVARTSVLSHRWRKLWKLYSGRLDFDASETMRLIFDDRTSSEEEAPTYRDWVNRVLDGHEGFNVEQLRIVFDLGKGYASNITEWIHFAIVKRVERLEIDLSQYFGCYMPSECSAYTFPSRLLLDSPSGSPSFHRLKSLSLKSVSVSESDVAYFLSTCQLLEQLVVEDSSSIKNVRVSGQSVKLKHLEIRFCLALEKVEVSSATSLTSFKYAGERIIMRFRDVPSLSLVSLRMDSLKVGEDLQKFVLESHENLNLFQLHRLELDFEALRGRTCLTFPSHFPEFSNLEELELKFVAFEGENLLFFSSIIGSAPRLQKLTLKHRLRSTLAAYSVVLDGSSEIIRDEEWEEEAGRHTYQSLKVIELVGWLGMDNYVQLANCLIQSAVSLDKIIIDLRRPNLFESSWGEDLLPPEEHRREAALSTALQLERKLPPGARLIVL